MDKLFLDSYVFLDIILMTEKHEKAMNYLEKVKAGKVFAATSTFAMLEVKYHVTKKMRHEKAEDAIYLITKLPNLEILPLDRKTAETAADIRFKYYDREKKALSFGDSIHIATAIVSGCSAIISGDGDFGGLEEIRCEIY